MSSLQSGEPAPFPYRTQNLSPPQPFDFSEVPEDDLDRQRGLRETARRIADIQKAQHQEAARWEQGTVERNLRKQQASTYLAEVIHLPVVAS